MNQLSVGCLLSYVGKRLSELNLQVEILQKKIKKAPVGRLRLGKSNGNVQYFWVKSNKDSQGKYLPKEKLGLVKALAQKRYDEMLLCEMLKEIDLLESFRKRLHPDSYEQIYSLLRDGRKDLVTPAILPLNVFVERWLAVPYENKGFENESAELYTSTGIRVRSKSEVIIADCLTRLGIPFRYEYPLKIGDGACWYPDFTCLNVRSRDEFLWEHFGMMEKPDYVQGFVSKIKKLSSAGYDVGRNLIISVENLNHPMSPAYAERLARKFLL